MVVRLRLAVLVQDTSQYCGPHHRYHNLQNTTNQQLDNTIPTNQQLDNCGCESEAGSPSSGHITVLWSSPQISQPAK